MLGLVKGDPAQRATEWRAIEADNKANAEKLEGEYGGCIDPATRQKMINENVQLAKAAGEYAGVYENASAS